MLSFENRLEMGRFSGEELALYMGPEHVLEDGLGSSGAGARPQAPENIQPTGMRIVQPVFGGIRSDGNPQVYRSLGFNPGKSGLRHADDREIRFLVKDRLAENRRARLKPACPKGVTQDGDAVPAQNAVVLRFEQASQGGLDSQDGKEVGGNGLTGHAFGRVRFETELAEAEAACREQVPEGCAGLAELLVEDVRRTVIRVQFVGARSQ